MNHLREEHCLPLGPRYLHRDSFTSLWEHIARQQHFLKLTFPFSDRSPTEWEIEEKLTHQDGSLSPYSTRMFRRYLIIYNTNGTVLLTNHACCSSLGTFFAIEDTDMPHRYFVGFAFPVAPYAESITGLLAYFDEKGCCDSTQTIVCSRVLTTYDPRNGLIRSSNAFLYHQTLLFTQVHRDTHKLVLYFSYIPYQTESIEDHVHYRTEIELPQDTEQPQPQDTGQPQPQDRDQPQPQDTSLPSLLLFQGTIHAAQRFLYIPKKDRTTLLLDMGSVAVIEGTNRYILFDTYTLYEKAYLSSFLEVAHLFPEKEYSDGYPLFCVRCHEPVVAATYTAKIAPTTTIQCGLGSGYCVSCRIRYSSSKESWVCAEIRLDGSICQGYLLYDTDCQSVHLHSLDQTIVTLYDDPLLKYPFRQKLYLQWIPSEEALVCAHRTTIRGDDSYIHPRTISYEITEVVEEVDDLFKGESEVI